MSRKKDWTREFITLAEGDTEPPESPKTYQILDLIAERDELKRAVEAAKEWLDGEIQASRDAGVLVIPIVLRELAAQLRDAIKNAKN